MWQKLKSLLNKMEQINYSNLSAEGKKKVKEDLLLQISFFQHERLVHLIVTVCVALLALINIVIIYISDSMASLILEVLFIGLLAPYLLHYYRLENGVQKLYEYIDKL